MAVLARLALGAAVLAAGAASAPARAQTGPPPCSPAGAPVVFTGSVTSSDASTYRTLPFAVAAGTTRVEIRYAWQDAVALPGQPFVQTVLDLGLWDEGGVGTPAGFRGWSGSRAGRTADGQKPIWVQADTAERGYRPDPVQPGTWTVDLGVGSVSPQGAAYTVTVTCTAAPVGPAFVSQPVDATHVARAEAGWYHGDFHMHGHHSNPRAPDWDGFIEFARRAQLDFLPVTDYVTNQHHRELGPVQKANPDLLVWPSREVITYYGHATVFGETPHEVDWRHGAPGVTLADIQGDSVADGALFGVAHPTIFPTPLFASFCRGCEFRLDDEIDWDLVTTMEVLTGPILADDSELGGPGLGVQIENPFVATAIDKWEGLLLDGHKITAVSGSDDKLGPGLGSSATAVYARELSRAALTEALRAGHAYVRTLGVAKSPSVELTARTADGQRGMVGDTFHAAKADVTVRVKGADGQLLRITRDGVVVDVRPISGDDATLTFTATRGNDPGPLGTFWRVDTQALTSGSSMPYLTTIGNPIFLAEGTPHPGPADPPCAHGRCGKARGQSATAAVAASRLPATGAAVPVGSAAVLGLLALAGLHLHRRAAR